VHWLLSHTGCELVTLFAHAIPHPLQLFGSLVVSTHDPEHSVEAAAGQPETHAYDPFDPAHTAAPASPLHALPQLPQLAALVYWTQAPLHSSYPFTHAKVHALWTHTASACETLVVHAFWHSLQLFWSLVVSTQASPQCVGMAAGQLGTQE